MYKRLALIGLFSSLLLAACAHRQDDAQDLAQLQAQITVLSQELSNGVVSADDALVRLTDLQKEYTQLTQSQLSGSLASVQELIRRQKSLGTLPQWAMDV